MKTNFEILTVGAFKAAYLDWLRVGPACYAPDADGKWTAEAFFAEAEAYGDVHREAIHPRAFPAARTVRSWFAEYSAA